MNIVLPLAVVTLAIIAIVLVVVAAKLVKGATKPSAAPSPPTFTPTATTTPTPQPAKAVPVQKRTDGETESFDISPKTHHVLWRCPCCDTENSSGSRCMVCAQSRSS